MGKRVEYPNGSVGFASEKVAEALAKRPGHKILGDAPPAAAPAPQKEPKRINRDALVKRAIKDGLGSKEEMLRLSDSELVALVGEE
jgi:hypothetical protein